MPAGHDVVVVARPGRARARRARGPRRASATALRELLEKAGRAVRRARVRIVQAPIVVYQRVISPALPRRCKYEPTCSAYAVQAISEFGILRGLVLATGACCAATR